MVRLSLSNDEVCNVECISLFGLESTTVGYTEHYVKKRLTKYIDVYDLKNCRNVGTGEPEFHN